MSAASTCRDHRIQPRNLRDIGFDRWGNWGTGRKGNVPKVILVGGSWIQAEFGFLYSASESSFHRILYAEVSPGNLGYGTFAGTDQSGELWALIAKNSQVRSRGREVGTMATPPPKKKTLLSSSLLCDLRPCQPFWAWVSLAQKQTAMSDGSYRGEPGVDHSVWVTHIITYGFLWAWTEL